MKECVVCNAEFEAKREHAKYCSNDCRNERRVKSIVDYPPKTSLHCGKTFQPSKNNHRVAKYCTPLCRSRKDTEENKKIRWEARSTIKCRECGIVGKPKRIDGITCGKRKCVDENRRKTRIKNGIKANAKGGHRYKKVRAYMKKYHKQRRETDSAFRLNQRISAGVRHSLRNKNGLKTFDLLDYTFDELYNHFESQFTEENGYSWDNMSEWHIDHIRPVASFNYDSTEHPDFKKCWALNNLQPLWAVDNISKGNKWDGVVNA